MNFRNFLSEAKDQLDISIQNADKWLTSDKKKDEFLSTPVLVDHKTDGIKITLIYKDTTGDFTKDWIVAYKGEIQYPAEFDFYSTASIKKSSIANAQFKIVFDHLKKITPTLKGIKKDSEFFVEFLMKKSTLSSNYKHSHGMVLIAFSKTTYTDKMGKLKSNPQSFNTKGRDDIAKKLKINTPMKLFRGILGSERDFEKGIINKELKSIFNTNKSSIDWSNLDNILMSIKEIFLEVESEFGGVEEGVVIEYLDGSRILKFQQSYQVDQVERAKIKAKWKEEDPEDEQTYWNNVCLSALSVIKVVTSNKLVKIQDFPETLGKCAQELKKHKLTYAHSKKNTIQIKDDIQGQIKLQLRKGLKGNNGSLILGRFQPLTLGHQKMITYAERRSDMITICVVRARKEDLIKNPFPLDLQKRMINEIYPNAEVITHSTGNLFGIMQKSQNNINIVWAGSDRVNSYRETLKYNNELSVKEIKRTGDDISATEVRKYIKDGNLEAFKKIVDKKLWKFWDELKDYVS